MLRKLVFALITLCCFAFLLGAWWYNDRPAFLYPPLPFQTVEKKVVVSQLKQADNQLIMLGPDENSQYIWGGAKTGSNAAEQLKSILKDAGWSFHEQEGAGYFFQKGSEKIVITSQMWSRDFVLFKIPSSLDAIFTHTE